MSDLHTYKVMQDGDADAADPRVPRAPSRSFTLALWTTIASWMLVLFVLYAPECLPGRTPDHSPTALSHVKQLALANAMYAADHDDRLPLAEEWMDETLPYAKNKGLYQDPTIQVRKKDEYGFAFFGPLSGVELGSVRDPYRVPLVFQSADLRRNAHSDLSTLPIRPRIRNRNYVGFLDSHAKSFPPTWPETPIVVVIDQGKGGKHDGQ